MNRRIPSNICHEILPNLYLGGQLATEYANDLEISFIISIGCKSKARGIENIHIGIKDDRTLNIQKELDMVIPLLDDLIQHNNRKVLVHCKAGMNRSPSFVLAYICKHLNLSVDESMEFILSKRTICKFSMKEQVCLWLTNNNLVETEI